MSNMNSLSCRCSDTVFMYGGKRSNMIYTLNATKYCDVGILNNKYFNILMLNDAFQHFYISLLTHTMFCFGSWFCFQNKSPFWYLLCIICS